MTHAEAVALRDANGLDPRCQIVITDGPVIGTPGNTSPTQIELNPAGPGDIGRTARIHTNFDNVAFAGLYNIDGSAAGGDINHLVDHWNNEVSDEDAGAPTVHTQFPYHLSGPNLRDNKVNDCTLTGWDTIPAGVVIWDNDLLESGVNLTGMGAGQFLRNQVVGSQVVISSPNVLFTSNDIRNSPVTYAGTAALSQSFQGNEVLSGSFEVTAATTGRVTAARNVIGGTGTLGFRTLVDGATGASTISGNRMFNQSTDPVAELLIGGNGASVTGNELAAPVIKLDGSGSKIITASKLLGTAVTKDPASTGALSINSSEMGTATVVIGPANAATTNSFLQCKLNEGVVTLNGPVAGGRNDFFNCHANILGVTVSATATAGVGIDGGYISRMTFNQNRTAGTGSTSLNDCDVRGFTTITDNGTVDPGQTLALNRCHLRDTIVDIGSLAARSPSGTIVQQLDAIGSTLNISGLGASGIIDSGRMTKSTLTNAGFSAQTFQMQGATKTLTADNLNVMADPSFDNFLGV
jgi:hypothetical protein